MEEEEVNFINKTVLIVHFTAKVRDQLIMLLEVIRLQQSPKIQKKAAFFIDRQLLRLTKSYLLYLFTTRFQQLYINKDSGPLIVHVCDISSNCFFLFSNNKLYQNFSIKLLLILTFVCLQPGGHFKVFTPRGRNVEALIMTAKV